MDFNWSSPSGSWIWHRQSIRQVESCPVVPGYLLKPTKSLIFIDFSKNAISGYATEPLKKYIKTIKIDRKIDAIEPPAAADNPLAPPGHNGKISASLPPQIPVK